MPIEAQVSFADLKSDPDFATYPQPKQIQYLQEYYLPKTDPDFTQFPPDKQLQYINEVVLPEFQASPSMPSPTPAQGSLGGLERPSAPNLLQGVLENVRDLAGAGMVFGGNALQQPADLLDGISSLATFGYTDSSPGVGTVPWSDPRNPVRIEDFARQAARSIGTDPRITDSDVAQIPGQIYGNILPVSAGEQLAMRGLNAAGRGLLGNISKAHAAGKASSPLMRQAQNVTTWLQNQQALLPTMTRWGASGAAFEGLRKPKEGESRLENAMMGGAMGAMLPAAGRALKPIAQQASKTLKGAVQAFGGKGAKPAQKPTVKGRGVDVALGQVQERVRIRAMFKRYLEGVKNFESVDAQTTLKKQTADLKKLVEMMAQATKDKRLNAWTRLEAGRMKAKAQVEYKKVQAELDKLGQVAKQEKEQLKLQASAQKAKPRITSPQKIENIARFGASMVEKNKKRQFSQVLAKYDPETRAKILDRVDDILSQKKLEAKAEVTRLKEEQRVLIQQEKEAQKEKARIQAELLKRQTQKQRQALRDQAALEKAQSQQRQKELTRLKAEIQKRAADEDKAVKEAQKLEALKRQQSTQSEAALEKAQEAQRKKELGKLKQDIQERSKEQAKLQASAQKTQPVTPKVKAGTGKPSGKPGPKVKTKQAIKAEASKAVKTGELVEMDYSAEGGRSQVAEAQKVTLAPERIEKTKARIEALKQKIKEGEAAGRNQKTNKELLRQAEASLKTRETITERGVKQIGGEDTTKGVGYRKETVIETGISQNGDTYMNTISTDGQFRKRIIEGKGQGSKVNWLKRTGEESPFKVEYDSAGKPVVIDKRLGDTVAQGKAAETMHTSARKRAAESAHQAVMKKLESMPEKERELLLKKLTGENC